MSSVFVFAVVNTSPANQTVDVSLLDVFVDQGRQFGSGTFTLFDLWQKDSAGRWGKSLGEFSGSVTVELARHQTKVYRATPVSNLVREL